MESKASLLVALNLYEQMLDPIIDIRLYFQLPILIKMDRIPKHLLGITGYILIKDDGQPFILPGPEQLE
jgi:hypothetical protein